MSESKSKGLRVLQIVASMSLGGAERVVASLSASLRRRGLQVDVASLTDADGDPLRSTFEKGGFPVHDLRARNFYDVTALWRLMGLIRQLRPNILHTHLQYADAMGRAAGALLGVPVVTTVHTAPEGVTSLRVDHAWVARFGARHLCSRVVVVSEQARNGFARDWRLPSNRIVEIPNGIELDRWVAVPLADPMDADRRSAPTLLSVGRLHPIKAHDVQIRAMASIVKEYPSARLILLGEGSLLDSLRALAEEVGVSDNVQFPGASDDVPTFMELADLFILSSRWEGMSLAAIEAMAAGRPLVMTDVGGNAEVLGSLTPGDSSLELSGIKMTKVGLLVEQSTPESLAKAVVTLLRDPDLRTSMARHGRARALASFSVDWMAERYADLYTDVVTEHVSRRGGTMRQRSTDRAGLRP